MKQILDEFRSLGEEGEYFADKVGSYISGVRANKRDFSKGLSPEQLIQKRIEEMDASLIRVTVLKYLLGEQVDFKTLGSDFQWGSEDSHRAILLFDEIDQLVVGKHISPERYAEEFYLFYDLPLAEEAILRRGVKFQEIFLQKAAEFDLLASSEFGETLMKLFLKDHWIQISEDLMEGDQLQKQLAKDTSWFIKTCWYDQLLGYTHQ